MSDYVKSIQAIGLHGRFDLNHEFENGVNILYGINGSGKTTLLHILANILNGDYVRFYNLSFSMINVILDDGKEINLIKERDDSGIYIILKITGMPERKIDKEDTIRYREGKYVLEYNRSQIQQLDLFDDVDYLEENTLKIDTAYFPAFRTMIEAWSSMREDKSTLNRREYLSTTSKSNRARFNATLLSRQLFGQFVPSITYPSPLEIEMQLGKDFRDSVVAIANSSQKLFSQTVLDIFAALSLNPSQTQNDQNLKQEDSEAIIDQIRALSIKLGESSFGAGSRLDEDFFNELLQQINSSRINNTETVALNILNIYRRFTEERVKMQENSFEGLRQYLKSVNEFLEGKKIEIVRGENTSGSSASVQIVYEDESSSDIQALSSGERQIVTMIYTASKMNLQKIVLIDEPEISLHIDWQRLLLKKMSEQLPGRQIIVCTHSPIIGADYEDHLVELKLRPTARSFQKQLFESFPQTDDEEEVF